jgi:sugar/nucleoside kinase (ribokinase family)
VVLDLGVGAVAVTCGADGCVVYHGAYGKVAVPTIPVHVVDTTGCGDGFDAGFITALLLGATPVEAAWLGTACGALVATGLGSDAGITSLDETLDILAERAPVRSGVEAAAALRRLVGAKASVVRT